MAKRHSSTKDGQIIPLLKLHDIITTIRAKWIVQLFKKGKWTSDKLMWSKQNLILIIHKQYKFPTIHHMLNSSYVMKKKSSSIKKANFSHYTHDYKC